MMEVVAQTKMMTLHVDHGVLVVRILVKSVMHEFVLEEMKEEISGQLPQAKTAVLFDCSQLTLHVTSQFLGMLAAVRKQAAKHKMQVCVCSLGGSLQQAFDVAHFSRIIPVYASAKEAILDLGEFDEWEKVRIESAAHYKAKHAKPPSQWSELAGHLRETSPAKLTAASVVVLLLLLGVGWYGYELFFAGPKLPRGRGIASAESLSSISKLAGEVSYLDHGVQLNDRGAVVVTWPAGILAPRKFDVSSEKLFAVKETPQTSMQDGLYVARAGTDGKFALDVHTPADGDDFYVLLISASLRRSGPPPAKDADLLSLYFANPSSLLGDKQYQLTRCPVRPDRPTRIESGFGSSANSQ